jgi:DNA-binding transcriptional regulator LsrR (DeoR family)
MAKKNGTARTWSEDRLSLMAGIADMYYEQNLTQEDISARLGYSRSAVSRLLTEARKAGIVEIRIHYPSIRNTDLEDALSSRFRLQEVTVLEHGNLPYSKMLRQLGELGARLLQRVTNDETVLGVSWGTGLYEIASAAQSASYPNMKVIQLVGSLGTSDPQIDGPELARWFARLFGGRSQTLAAPAIVDSPAVRDALLADSRIRDVLDLAHDVNLALVGIGTVDTRMSSLIRAGYLTVEEVQEAAESGAVGDICGIHFDIHGNVLDIPLARRTVGVQADALRRIPLVIGIAGGEPKARPILGALRGQLINGLVTDDVAARKVLELAVR